MFLPSLIKRTPNRQHCKSLVLIILQTLPTHSIFLLLTIISYHKKRNKDRDFLKNSTFYNVVFYIFRKITAEIPNIIDTIWLYFSFSLKMSIPQTREAISVPAEIAGKSTEAFSVPASFIVI